MLRKYSIGVLFIFLLISNLLAVSITPTDVYKKLLQLEEEVLSIKNYFNIEQKISVQEIKTDLFPRHVWQRTYELFVKINITRRKYGLPIIEPINMEPTLNLEPIFIYEQILRLIQEIHILKLRLDISTIVKSDNKDVDLIKKSPTDVYNLLSKISLELDLINGSLFTPSYVFGEVVRVYNDVDLILNKLNIIDNSTPKAFKDDTTPLDVYKLAIILLNNIKYLEVNSGIKSVDFYAFRRSSVSSSNVFEIIQIVLSELQVVKAYLGLNHNITRGSEYYMSKTPKDVAQLLNWTILKFGMIKSLNVKLEY